MVRTLGKQLPGDPWQQRPGLRRPPTKRGTRRLALAQTYNSPPSAKLRSPQITTRWLFGTSASRQSDSPNRN